MSRSGVLIFEIVRVCCGCGCALACVITRASMLAAVLDARGSVHEHFVPACAQHWCMRVGVFAITRASMGQQLWMRVGVSIIKYCAGIHVACVDAHGRVHHHLCQHARSGCGCVWAFVDARERVTITAPACVSVFEHVEVSFRHRHAISAEGTLYPKPCENKE